MIKIFRKIRKQDLAENKASKYALYAFGEIVLVMVGILLALQVNNWNEHRKDLNRGQVYLNQLLQNLNTDLDFLKRNVEYYSVVLESGTRVLAYSKKDSILKESNWELLVDAFHASQIWPVILDKSTYEELKSAGEIALLQSENLKNNLGIYYGLGATRYAQTIGINPPYRKMSRMLIPYDVQGYMWEACNETKGDNQILKKCEASISEKEAGRLLDILTSNADLMGELGFYMSSIRAGNAPLLEQIKLCESMINSIETTLLKT